jgi:hypothetical protein
VIVCYHMTDWRSSEVVSHENGWCCSEQEWRGKKGDPGYAKAHRGHPIELQTACYVLAVVYCVQAVVCYALAVVCCVLVAACCVIVAYCSYCRSSHPSYPIHGKNYMLAIEKLCCFVLELDY